MCSIQISSKYIWGIGLKASNLENRHVGSIQSRDRVKSPYSTCMYIRRLSQK